MIFRRPVLACIVVLLLPGCTHAITTNDLRPFQASDGYLLNINPQRASDIAHLQHTWVAKTDFSSQPTCDSKDKFIVVAKQPHIGQWLGGDLGCRVLELSIANHEPEFVFNPFCQLSEQLIFGNCLRAASSITTPAEMMLRLRPASLPEILQFQIQQSELSAADIEDNGLPIPKDLNRWFVVTGTEPFTLWPLFGSKALEIIVPNSVLLSGGQIGQNQLYLDGSGPYSDPLCAAIVANGLDQLPLKLSGDQLDYGQNCQLNRT